MIAAVLLFNHFFVTPSRGTFEAVERSEAARALGAWEKRTTVRKDTTYTGLYLYGENTYLELLHPDSDLGAPYGIAFSGRFGDTRLISRGDAPWFLMSDAQAPSNLAVWGMEYVPGFFAKFHPELPPAHAGVSRADALTRYAAACGKLRERAEGLFEDVAALDVTVAGDWQPPETDVQLNVTRGEETAITAVTLKLRRDAGRAEHRLGTTTLSLDGRRAVWRF